MKDTDDPYPNISSLNEGSEYWFILDSSTNGNPLAISLVIAANFAFDIANRKNLYGEPESQRDIFTDLDEEEDSWDDKTWEDEEEDVNDIEVDFDQVEEEDWKVVDNEPEPKPVKIVQKGPSRHRVLFDDGQQRRVDKDDNIIKYL